MTALRLQTADVRHQIPGPPSPRTKAKLRGAGYGAEDEIRTDPHRLKPVLNWANINFVREHSWEYSVNIVGS